jgi:hypothetical protein
VIHGAIGGGGDEGALTPPPNLQGTIILSSRYLELIPASLPDAGRPRGLFDTLSQGLDFGQILWYNGC